MPVLNTIDAAYVGSDSVDKIHLGSAEVWSDYSPAGPGDERATGGTITYVDEYVIHTFTSSGTFTPTSGAISCEYLVVGGGGGGGGRSRGGGGGAGGLETGVGLSGIVVVRYLKV